MILAHGFSFNVEKLLFLSKTFESVSNGELQLELEDGCNAISVMSTFEERLFDEIFS